MIMTINNMGYEIEYHFLFRHLNCTVQEKDCLAIRGKNGSGKSTFLRILAGLLMPTEGSIQGTCQSELQYIGHKNALKNNLTVYENLIYYCALMRVKKMDFNFILKKINLFHLAHLPAAQLSAGQLRRLTLAKLLLKPAALWLLDEPTTALDDEGQSILFELIQHQLTHGSVIIATHQDIPYVNKTMQLGMHYV